MKRQMLARLLFAGMLLEISGCKNFNPEALFITDRYIVVIDQTDSTKELRRQDEIRRFLLVLTKRPNLEIRAYGMMPDRVYPTLLSGTTLQELLTQSYGVRKDGTYTGGDLQHVINLFDNEEGVRVIIITDGENNIGNTPTSLPRFSHPEKFYLIGVRNDLAEGYDKLGTHAVPLCGVQELIKQLISNGRL
jgi:hypothetical protein